MGKYSWLLIFWFLLVSCTVVPENGKIIESQNPINNDEETVAIYLSVDSTDRQEIIDVLNEWINNNPDREITAITTQHYRQHVYGYIIVHKPNKENN